MVKPTPTQEENDLAAMGQHVMLKEDDGSGGEPVTTTKQVEAAKPPSGYQTRRMPSKEKEKEE